MSMKKKKRPVLGYLPINTSLDNSINTNNSLNVSDKTYLQIYRGSALELVLIKTFRRQNLPRIETTHHYIFLKVPQQMPNYPLPSTQHW